jgi:hypothetical protein
MRWTLDDERSTLAIDARSSIHPIHTLTRVAGWVDLDADGQPVEGGAGEVIGAITFDITAMRSGNPLIDRESERRLQPKRYPTVSGELTALRPRGDGGLDGTGRLTFHGVTRDLQGVLHASVADDELRLHGTTTIDVTDFGVQPPSLLVVKVHKDITVTLDAVATR